LLQDYQPVISKRTWIILLATFVALMVYISFSGSDSSAANEPGLWNAFKDSLSKINTGETSIWKKGMGIFSTVPPVAYLIVIASLALWTLDSVLSRLRHDHAKINAR
jgi:Trk-type K+ transport system membrane component